jgi:undecaprenyl diphosphate synthase
MLNTLNHIAIIMDGNRRWAKKNKLDQIEGHRKGIETAKFIAKHCHNKNIKELTLYAFSMQNWKRPKLEIKSLLKLFSTLFEDKSHFFIKNNFKFNPIGRIDELNEAVKTKINSLKEKTEANDAMTINVAINYGGIEEIIDTYERIALNNEKNIDRKILKKYSYLPESNEIDLIIRTGGYSRLSNFLNLHNSYSELEISNILWPDFNQEDFEEILSKYEKIERNYGK